MHLDYMSFIVLHSFSKINNLLAKQTKVNKNYFNIIKKSIIKLGNVLNGQQIKV